MSDEGKFLRRIHTLAGCMILQMDIPVLDTRRGVRAEVLGTVFLLDGTPWRDRDA